MLPSSSNQETLERAWSVITGRAGKVKTLVQNLRDQSAGGDTPRPAYVNLRVELQLAIDRWEWVMTHPRIVVADLQAFARNQTGNMSFDLVVEHAATATAVIALRDWVDLQMPTHSATAAVLERLVDGTPLTFSSSQTAAFRTQADLVLATID